MNIKIFKRIDSTNSEMKRRAAKQKLAKDWSIMSYCQTAGRGRGQRTWNALPNESLAASYWIDVSNWENKSLIGVLPLLAGLAVSEAAEKRLRSLNREACQIERIGLKWPNDVLIKDVGKLSGVLCELIKNEQNFGVVVGIGINLQDRCGRLKNLPQSAAVWHNVFKDYWPVKEAFINVGSVLFKLADCLVTEGFAPIAEKWYQRCLHKDSEIRVKKNLSATDVDFLNSSVSFNNKANTLSDNSDSEVICGFMAGLGLNGELLLTSAEDKIEKVTIGDVSFQC
ncbi:MAG: biotin--[acetyl-CoA-carboxylase] ligase [Candidatus Bruticola sp.]